MAAAPAAAERLRLATYNVGLGHKGPGLLLRDILSGKNQQVEAVAAVIRHISPDVLLLVDFDYDLKNVALTRFAERLAAAGAPYPFRFALAPNAGYPSGLDLDGNGRVGGAGDAWGYGRFPGSGGMAILSRLPIEAASVQDYTRFLWKDLPGARLPERGGEPLGGPRAREARRLSAVGHWDVPLRLADGRSLHILASNPTPPVFDGPEDRNGLRNRDEIRFWSLHLERLSQGALFAILGDLNADPQDGEGAHGAVAMLLADPRLVDLQPASAGAVGAAARQGGANDAQRGPARLDTVDWRDGENGPGNLRVDYVLPSATLGVLASGVYWPGDKDGAAGPDAESASRHRLVWVDVETGGE